MARISLSEADTPHTMVVKGPKAPKCIRTGLTGNCIVYTLQELSDLLDHVNPHIVRPTISLFETAKGAVFIGTVKLLGIQGRMTPPSTITLQVLLQRLLMNKEPVTVFTLVLPCRIMTIQMHTHRAGLGRREITLGARIQARLILEVFPFSWHFKWIRDSGLPE
jgi:hypothetical protein